MKTLVQGRSIEIGYEWRQRITVTADSTPFPSGVAITSHVRALRESSTILATLTTGNGGITRVSDTAIDIVIPAASTASMSPGSVILDLVRTDTDPDQHLGFALTIPVVQPVTRGL